LRDYIHLFSQEIPNKNATTFRGEYSHNSYSPKNSKVEFEGVMYFDPQNLLEFFKRKFSYFFLFHKRIHFFSFSQKKKIKKTSSQNLNLKNLQVNLLSNFFTKIYLPIFVENPIP